MSASAIMTTEEQDKIWNSWLISEDDMIEYRIIFEQVDNDKDGFIRGSFRLLFRPSISSLFQLQMCCFFTCRHVECH